VDTDVHYYAPREELIEKAYTQLMGNNPQKGGHYITVWAPRQCGKTWVMQQILVQLQKNPRFDVLKINLEHLKEVEDASAATVALPNNNILNLISKAKKEHNKTFLLEMFQTGEKLEFTFDDPTINDLYMNGLVDKELGEIGARCSRSRKIGKKIILIPQHFTP
jgi:hypothetical protein